MILEQIPSRKSVKASATVQGAAVPLTALITQYSTSGLWEALMSPMVIRSEQSPLLHPHPNPQALQNFLMTISVGPEPVYCSRGLAAKHLGALEGSRNRFDLADDGAMKGERKLNTLTACLP